MQPEREGCRCVASRCALAAPRAPAAWSMMMREKERERVCVCVCARANERARREHFVCFLPTLLRVLSDNKKGRKSTNRSKGAHPRRCEDLVPAPTMHARSVAMSVPCICQHCGVCVCVCARARACSLPSPSLVRRKGQRERETERARPEDLSRRWGWPKTRTESAV